MCCVLTCIDSRVSHIIVIVPKWHLVKQFRIKCNGHCFKGHDDCFDYCGEIKIQYTVSWQQCPYNQSCLPHIETAKLQSIQPIILHFNINDLCGLSRFKVFK